MGRNRRAGFTQKVHGPGVVGEQPMLEPGENFEYTSGTPLETPSGFMVGEYHMIAPDSGEEFDVAIPPSAWTARIRTAASTDIRFGRTM